MSEYKEIRGSLQGEWCEHKSWADLCETCEIDRLRAKNERLRAALEEIASGKYSGIVLLSHPPQDPAINRARAALEGK